MPAPTSPEVRRQVLELSSKGHTSRVIAAMLGKRGIGIGHVTVQSIINRAPQGSPSGAGATTLNREAETAGGAPPPTVPGVDVEGLDAAALADMDLVQLTKLGVLLDDSIQSAVRFKETRLLGGLYKTRQMVSNDIARHRPPVAPDPARDPANTVARDELRRRLERLLASSRQSGAGLALLEAHVVRAREAVEGRPLPEAAE